MRLTKAEGELILGAIGAELESTFYKRQKRGDYPNALTDTWHKVEQALRAEEDRRAVELRTLSQRIKEQL